MLRHRLRQIFEFCNGVLACLLMVYLLYPRALDLLPWRFPVSQEQSQPDASSTQAPQPSSLAMLQPVSIPGEDDLPMTDIERPPPDLLGYARDQHTPAGRVQLGHWFFVRFAHSNQAQYLHPEVEKWIFERNQGAYPGPDRTPDSFVVRDPGWPQMSVWWNTVIHTSISPDNWVPAKRRFEALSKNTVRTPDEDRELWQLVVTCGREWLKVPYDRLTDRFDLEAELPDDAPEVACRYYRRMYRAVTGFTYGEKPADGWRSGGRIGTDEPDFDMQLPDPLAE